MKFQIIKSPNSYLLLELSKNEKIIIEKGCLIYSDGEYNFENKIEVESYKNIISKILGGKSLTYNIYTANENLKMGFSPKDTAEIFSLDINKQNQIIFYGSQHFARTYDIQIKIDDLSEPFLVKTEGAGTLFLKRYGQIIEKSLNSNKPLYVDEDALIGFQESIKYEWITGGAKKLISSGDGGLYKLRGKGKVWIQSKEKIEYKEN